MRWQPWARPFLSIMEWVYGVKEAREREAMCRAFNEMSAAMNDYKTAVWALAHATDEEKWAAGRQVVKAHDRMLEMWWSSYGVEVHRP